ncbi:uncharacterized protein LOC144585167 [Pogona vitticeps]
MDLYGEIFHSETSPFGGQKKSTVQNERGPDIPGAQKDGPLLWGRRTVPEAYGNDDPQGHVKLECRASPPPSEAPSLEPQDSDAIPSVLLAGGLALVFVLVSLCLFHHDSKVARFRACRVETPNQTKSSSRRQGLCRLLDPNQPPMTGRTSEHPLRGQTGKGTLLNGRGVWAALAVGDAGHPVFCLVKAALPFKEPACQAG